KVICGTNEALHMWDMKSGKLIAVQRNNSEIWFEVFDFKVF
ncbi:21174_t:CDS:2, partial [Entrophospora sp. SA101]